MLLIEIFGIKKKHQQTNDFRTDKGIEYWTGWFRTYLKSRPNAGKDTGDLSKFIAKTFTRNADFQSLSDNEKKDITNKMIAAI